MDTTSVIIRPIITEQSIAQANLGKFTFEVAKFAHKNHIKKAVEEAFSVQVVAVSTSIKKGGSKRFGTRRLLVKKGDTKKAIVTLEKGQKIDLFVSS